MRVAATCDGGLLLERVGGELGRLGVDVDRRAVGAHGAAVPSTCVREAGALDSACAASAGAHRRGERAVEVDVDALVAGRVGVGEVGGQRLLALGGALDGALEGELRGVEEHGTGSPGRKRGRSVLGPHAAPSLERTPLIGGRAGDLEGPT